MSRRLRVLVVMPNPVAARATRDWVQASGFEAVICTSFAGSRRHLRRTPDVVIADVRLGAFNGLHVAIRAQWEGIPSIVIGPDDAVLRKEARALGVSYVTPDVSQQALLALVDNLATMRLTRTARLEWLEESDPIAAQRPASPERYLTH